MMTKGLAIIMFSGEAEKFIPLAVLTQTAANLGIPVRVFVTGFALPYFTKNKPEPRFSKEFEDMVPALVEGMKKLNMPGWYDIVKEAKEAGDVKIYVCSLMAEVVGLKREDLDPIVDDMVGATYFLSNIEGYEVIFI
ncbi:MAG: DsrE/DsrF/DrsH-like family protein [Desulfurococcales archaeon]|nr:DsrE/DsrF/DrsH-like family protein [Desulfurococcales archaeon]